MKMEPWKSHLRHARRFRSPWSATAAVPGATALIAWLAEPSAALAQDNVVATATLPRDLSPWGMFLNADPVVKAVLIGLAFASLVTWTVWLAKSIEIFFAKRRVRAASKALAGIRSLENQQLAEIQGEVAQFLGAAATELKLSPGLADNDGIKERIASRLERIEANCGRRILRGTGVLATIGATAPFVGLFGTVWGIMNSFIGISKAHTTNLAVVAPGIDRAAREARRCGCSTTRVAMSVRLDHGEDTLDEVHQINVAPFIDVMLVLLIIFMVAAPLATIDIAVNLPASTAKPQPRPERPLYLSVKSDLTLSDLLGGTLDAAANGDKDTRIFLRADKAVPYGEMMEVMNLLRAAGYLKVALVGLEKTQ